MPDQWWEWEAPERNAWLKAIRLEENSTVEWDHEEHVWMVTSASQPGRWYCVFERDDIPYVYEWWHRLGCSCPAGEANRRACWHRARVALMWTREAEIA